MRTYNNVNRIMNSTCHIDTVNGIVAVASCMHACLFVCRIPMHVCVCSHASMCVCGYIHVRLCMHVCMYNMCVCVCSHVCICVYICRYKLVWMYECMYMCMNMHVKY